MFTTDDQRALRVLKATRAAYDDTNHWSHGTWEISGPEGVTQRCMVGEIMHQCGGRYGHKWKSEESRVFYRSLYVWLDSLVGPYAPEAFNDLRGVKGVRSFLDKRVKELEAELLPPVRPLRALVTASLSFFGIL